MLSCFLSRLDKLSVGEEEQEQLMRNEVYEIYSIEETATKPSGSCSLV